MSAVNEATWIATGALMAAWPVAWRRQGRSPDESCSQDAGIAVRGRMHSLMAPADENRIGGLSLPSF